MSRTFSFSRLAMLATALLLAAPALQAQSLTIPNNAPTAAPSLLTTSAPDVAAPIGPVVTSVGVSRSAVVPGAVAAIQDSPTRRDVAWMVLGGATLIVGSIVGGDGGTILMVTGGVIGLVGLWRYLQYS